MCFSEQILNVRFQMAPFSWRDNPEFIRWYRKWVSHHRDLAEMMLEHGLDIDHTTSHRLVQHDAPEMERRLRWYVISWRVG